MSTRRTLAAELVDWAIALEPTDLPDDLVEVLKLRLLDTTGLILRAWELPEVAPIRALFERQGGAPEARLLVRGSLPASSAAAVHGTLAHALDYDDTLLDSLLHVSSVVFPTVLAAGDANDVSGADALTAAAAAYEVAARLGAAAGRRFHERGFHATGVLGPLFAAVAAARLYGLDAPAALSAVGIAGSMGSGLLEFLSDGSATKRLHPGWAARAGIDAATLARDGFSGPASVLEGKFGVYAAYLGDVPTHGISDDLGERWLAREGSFKLYPCAHVLHPYIDAVLDLRRAAGVVGADVARIAATMPELEVELFARPAEVKASPRTEYESRASLPYVLAAACCDGAVGLETFVEPSFWRPDVIRLAAAVDVAAGDGRRLTLELTDGTRLEADTEAFESRATRDAVIAKFEQNAATMLPPRAVRSLRDAILTLEDRQIREVIDLTRGGS